LGQAKKLQAEQLAQCVNLNTAHLPSWSEKKRRNLSDAASNTRIDSIFKRVAKALPTQPADVLPASPSIS